MEGTNGYRTGEADMAPDMEQQRQREKRGLKAARAHFSRLGGMFMLGTVVIFTVQLAAEFVVSLLHPEWLFNGDVVMMLSILPMYVVGMPVLMVVVRAVVPGGKVQRRPIKAWQLLAAVIMCFASVYITNILGNFITSIIGILKGGAVQNQIQEVTQSVSLWVIVLYMVICAPVLEEYVFRKMIVERTVRYGEATAVLVSGLMFGLFHGNLNQFAYAFVLGAFLAFLYVKTGNLKITIAIHMLINLMGGFVSTVLSRAVDLDGYLEALENMDIQAMMAIMSENMAGLLAYGVFLVFVFGNMIAGLVLFIVCLVKKRFVCRKGEISIPKGKRFSTIFLNVGMILYILFWIAVIILQLLV